MLYAVYIRKRIIVSMHRVANMKDSASMQEKHKQTTYLNIVHARIMDLNNSISLWILHLHYNVQL